MYQRHLSSYADNYIKHFFSSKYFFLKMTGCSALHCKSRSEKGVRLFRFPRDAKRKAKWVKNMNREKGWKPTVNSRLCEVNYTQLDINNIFYY